MEPYDRMLFLDQHDTIFCCKMLLVLTPLLVMLQLSFIRGSNHSLPSSHKRGLSTARCSFIFGRDDSNSMSTTSVSEDSSDTVSSIWK